MIKKIYFLIKNMKKNKLLFFSILILFFISLIIAYIVYSYLANNESVNTGNNINTIKDKLLEEANREAIKNAEQELVNEVRPIDEEDHYWGNINAQVQIIIYDDFECPFCALFYDTTEQIKNEFLDMIVIAFRHYPLSSHPNAIPAGLASECAAEQGKFWQMYDKLFTDNKEKRMSVEQFKKDAVDIDLDIAQFNQCLETEKYKEKIQTQMLEGKNVGVSGTPTIFVNKEILPGAYQLEDFTGSDGQPKEGMRSIINRHLENF